MIMKVNRDSRPTGYAFYQHTPILINIVIGWNAFGGKNPDFEKICG